MSIGERISKLRAEQNISQNQLAKAMEVSRQAVSKWENDLSTPDPIKLIHLAELLDTDVEYLATGKYTVLPRQPEVITVEKIVEKPIEVIVEKPVYIERVVERIVPIEVEKRVIRKVFRTKYVIAPFGSILLALGCFLLGLLLGMLY
jgi:transcriptional regulator with XRE-family HTH domain